MKKILKTALFSLVILSFSIVACKKDSDAPGNNNNSNNNNSLSDCNLRNYGTVEIFNNSKGNNAYRLEFSNSSSSYRIAGRAKEKYNVTAGSVEIKATQLEGYVLYPSVYTTTLKIEKCGNYYWEF
jgi:hypothetical protein